MKSPLEQFDIINIKNIYSMSIDISFNNIFLPILSLVIFIVLYIYVYIYNTNFIVLNIQWILEKIYIFLNNLIKQQAGNYGLFWLPFIFSLFNLILLSNLLSLIPYGIALTSHFILIFWLSCTICISIFIIGLLRFNLKFLYIFIPSSPIELLPILIPIEIFSYLIRLFSLAIRLAANIIAGHTLVHIIISFFLNIIKIDLIISIFILVPLYLIIGLEFGVAFLQAYVFTVLFCIYLSDTEKVNIH